MPREFSRTKRVAEQIKRELAPLIQRAANENRLGLLTVTSVDVSADLRNARIYVTHLGGDVDHDGALAALGECKSRLRHHLAVNLRMRVTPSLSFRFDESLERGARISSLLDEVATDFRNGDAPGALEGDKT